MKRNEKLDSETRLKGTPEKEREDAAVLTWALGRARRRMIKNDGKGPLSSILRAMFRWAKSSSQREARREPLATCRQAKSTVGTERVAQESRSRLECENDGSLRSRSIFTRDRSRQERAVVYREISDYDESPREEEGNLGRRTSRICKFSRFSDFDFCGQRSTVADSASE